MPANPLKVSVYGLGNFGYALLKHLSNIQAEKKFCLFGYDINPDLIKSLKNSGKHTIHHRDTKISNQVNFVSKPTDLVEDADVLVLAVTSDAIREVIADIKSHVNKNIIVINTAKSLDNINGAPYSEIIKNELNGINHDFSIAMLAGGTIASDLFEHKPLGADIASNNKDILPLLKDIFTSDNLNISISTDLIGVEYASAFKNIIAILAGIVHGLGFPYGSETYVISRAAAEAERLAINLGAKPETFSITSQCWGNDMIMSCTGKTRNREFGIMIGQGLTGKEALKEMKRKHKTVEGTNTLKAVNKILKGDSDKYPLLSTIDKIVFKDKINKDQIIELLAI